MRRFANVLFLLFLGCAVGGPASAAGAWYCSTTSQSASLKGLSDRVRFEVVGDILVSQSMAPKSPSIPGTGTWVSTSQLKILENNDVGIVAYYSQSRIYKSNGPLYRGIGPVVGAVVTVISKSDGRFRAGSIMADGPHDMAEGHCEFR